MNKTTIIGIIAVVILIAVAIAGAYFLSMDTDTGLEDDLDKGIISEGLKKEFEIRGFTISENTTIRKENDYEWVIEDKGKGRIYRVRKEGEKLNIVYFYPTPVAHSIFRDTSPAPYQHEPGEPGTYVACPGGPDFTVPLNLTWPYNQSLIPLPFGCSGRSPEPGAKDVPLDTCITVSFGRPPPIVKLEIEPEVEISHVEKEYVQVASGKFTFYPAKPLQPETNYTITITFGQTEPPKGGTNFALYQIITWNFTTEPTASR